MKFLIKRSDLVTLRYSLETEKFYLWQDCRIEEDVLSDAIDLLHLHVQWRLNASLSSLKQEVISLTKEDATILLKLHDELIRGEAVLESRAIYNIVNEIWGQMIDQELAVTNAS